MKQRVADFALMEDGAGGEAAGGPQGIGKECEQEVDAFRVEAASNINKNVALGERLGGWGVALF